MASDVDPRPQERNPTEPRAAAALEQAVLEPRKASRRRIGEALVGAKLLIALTNGGGERPDLTLLAVPQPGGDLSLLAFTDQDALDLWRPQAGFAAAEAPGLARYALENGLGAIRVNAAGPVSTTVDEDGLRALATGLEPEEEDGDLTLRAVRTPVDPNFVARLGETMRGCDPVAAAYLLEPRGDPGKSRIIIGLALDEDARAAQTVRDLMVELSSTLWPVAPADRRLAVTALRPASVAALRRGGAQPVFERR